MKKQRAHYAADEKAAILRLHSVAQTSASALCDRIGLAPTVFYGWQNEFAGGASQDWKIPTGGWAPHATLDQIVDFVRCCPERAETPLV